MMNTIRKSLWNPWHEMLDFDNAFAPLFNRLNGQTEFPPANVWTSDSAITFTFAIPGVTPESIDVTAKFDTLTVKGTRKAEEAPEGAMFLRQERGSGFFARSFALPFKCDTDNVSATYSNGILTITLQKAKEVQPRKITVCNA